MIEILLETIDEAVAEIDRSDHTSTELVVIENELHDIDKTLDRHT